MRRRIGALLQDHPEGLTPAELRTLLGIERSLADTCLGMLRYGLVQRVGQSTFVRILTKVCSGFPRARGVEVDVYIHTSIHPVAPRASTGDAGCRPIPVGQSYYRNTATGFLPGGRRERR
jgi:hypothetical protein